MGSVDDTSAALRRIFTACQEDSVSVGKSVSRFRKVWDGHRDGDDDEDDTDTSLSIPTKRHFFDRFVHYLQLPLTSKERTPYVDKCLEVACRFAASFLKAQEEKHEGEENGEAEEDSGLQDIPQFMHWLFDWLLDHHEVEGSQARLRICLVLNHLLKMMGEDASIDDDLYQKIFDNMLLRLKDKVADIRSQAVTALQRLQDPRDPECPIVRAFVFHMACDPSPIVRRTVVRVIGASRLTLSHVLKRTRDVDVTVRKAAFKYVAEKIHLKCLTIAQREEVLRRGLGDRAEGVRSVIERDLVPAWLHLCNNSIVELLYALDVGNSADDGKVAADTVAVLFRALPFRELVDGFTYVDANRLIPYEKLTSETACYWRHLVAYLHAEGAGAAELCEQKLMPELSDFCRYLRHYVLEVERPPAEDGSEDLGWTFAARQLISMTTMFDFSDEVGRANLAKLCKDLLCSPRVSSPFVEPMMSVFAEVCRDVDARIREVAEVVAELRDPLKAPEEEDDGDSKKKKNACNGTESRDEGDMAKDAEDEDARKRQVRVAKLRLQLNVLKNDLEDAVQDRDFVRAQEIQARTEELKAEYAKLQEEVNEAARIREAELPKVDDEEDADAEAKEAVVPNDDPAVVLKCLSILYQLMQDTKIEKLDPTLRTLLAELVLPAVRVLDPEIRVAAVRALGVFSLRCLDVAKKNLVLLIQVGHLDQTDVRVAALAMVNDLLLWFGLGAFMSTSAEDDDDDSDKDDETPGTASMLTQSALSTQGGTSAVSLLTNLLDDPDEDVRAKVAEGMCKLLMVGAVSSPRLLQRLVLMWYNPAAADGDGGCRMRHVLGTFFPLYASVSRSNQDCLEEALLPTLKTIWDAPVTSPLAEINPEDVGTFFVQLTREDFLQVADSQGPNVHDSLAFSLSNEILSDADDFAKTKVLTKLLAGLQVTSNDFVKLRELRKLAVEMLSAVSDKPCVKNLDKFLAILNEHISRDPKGDETETEEDGETGDDNSSQDEDGGGSADSTKVAAKKQRTLFSQVNHTVLSPGAAASPSSSSVGEDPFVAPLPPSSRLHSQKFTKNFEGEVTRIEESSDDDGEEEEEELVSGNLSRRAAAANVPEINIVAVSTDDDEDDKMFPSKKLAATPSSTDGDDDDDVTSSSAEGRGVVQSFFGRSPGAKERKLRKTATPSTTEDDDGEEEDGRTPVTNKLKRTKKSTNVSPSSSAAGKKTGKQPASKKKASAATLDADEEDGRRRSPRVRRTGSGSSMGTTSGADTPLLSSTRKSTGKTAPSEEATPSPSVRATRSGSRTRSASKK